MDYQKRLQKLLLQIPQGKVTSYREIGKALGTRGYHFVGHLLGSNPLPEQFPCYKVVCSDGSLGGYNQGQPEKIRRLKLDGISVKNGKVANFRRKLFKFDSDSQPLHDSQEILER